MPLRKARAEALNENNLTTAQLVQGHGEIVVRPSANAQIRYLTIRIIPLGFIGISGAILQRHLFATAKGWVFVAIFCAIIGYVWIQARRVLRQEIRLDSQGLARRGENGATVSLRWAEIVHILLVRLDAILILEGQSGARIQIATSAFGWWGRPSALMICRSVLEHISAASWADHPEAKEWLIVRIEKLQRH